LEIGAVSFEYEECVQYRFGKPSKNLYFTFSESRRMMPAIARSASPWFVNARME
jgi:hypothetical protein